MINIRILRFALAPIAVSLAVAAVTHVGLTLSAAGEALALTKPQSDAMNSYNEAISRFKSVLRQRRARLHRVMRSTR